MITENIRHLDQLKLDLSVLNLMKVAYQKILTEELKSRKALEALFTESDSKAIIKPMENRDSVEEDSKQCKYCTDLCYLSMI